MYGFNYTLNMGFQIIAVHLVKNLTGSKLGQLITVIQCGITNKTYIIHFFMIQ